MRIEPFFDDRTSTLTYVVSDEATKDAVVVDPVLDYEPQGGRVFTESVERVARYVSERGLKVHFVLETHVHADHLSGAQALVSRFGAKVAVGERIREVQAVFRDVFNLGEGFATDGRQFDLLLSDGQGLRAGALTVRVLATPGHTPACTSLLVEDAVFTGDTLFLPDVGVGRCDFPRGDAGALWDSVTQRLYALPDATRVFPGHDYPPATRGWLPATTIGESRRQNVHLPASVSRADFVEARTARDKALAAPRLLFPALQVNIAAGALPAPESNGTRYLKIPLKAP